MTEAGDKTKADEKIRTCIDQRQSFLLDAGAGSGKTRSLVEALRYLMGSGIGSELARNNQRIACITFTNVAKNQVVERTGDSPLLHVSTIHDFLWSVVKPHQSALKRALVSHNMALDAESRRKRDPAALDIALRVVKVNYSDRGAEFLEGRLFHDDLIDVARLLFKGNPLMAKIAAAQFPYIFVDEYQDTSEAVVEILIDRILATSEGKVVIGFFGDKLQSIYHGGEHPGIGEIPAAQREKLAVVVKEENYRCSKAVIAVLNHIRRDIQQFPAGKNAEGLAVYMRVPPPKSGDDLIGNARTVLIEKFGLSLEGAQQRELFLTHRLIARKAGYERLLKAYADRGGFSRDQLLRGDDPIISFFRDQVEPLIAAWEAGKVGKVISVLRAGGFVLANRSEERRVGKECR